VIGCAALLLLSAAIIISIVVAKHLGRETAAPQAEASAIQDPAVSGETGATSRETLTERLEAASVITDATARNRSSAAVSIDAAKAGEVDLVKDSLRQISNLTDRVQAAHEAVRLLAKRGLRKQAIEIAKTIEDVNIRNQALSELAQ
jgi:hypothetical protein